MKTYDILIIGAGSIGLPTAYYFANKGVSVAVLDKKASIGRGQNRAGSPAPSPDRPWHR